MLVFFVGLLVSFGWVWFFCCLNSGFFCVQTGGMFSGDRGIFLAVNLFFAGDFGDYAKLYNSA